MYNELQKYRSTVKMDQCIPKFIDATTRTSIPILQILPAITTETPQDADSPSLLSNSCRRKKNSIHQLYSLPFFLFCLFFSLFSYFYNSSRRNRRKVQNKILYIFTSFVAATDNRCLSFFSRWHSPHQLEKSF